MTTFVNLTPHEINVLNEDKKEILTIPPSGRVARIETAKSKTGECDRVPLFVTSVTGKPVLLDSNKIEHPFPSQDDTRYVVSGMFRAYFDREDLWQPGELVRDSEGKPVGCIGLSR